MKAVQASHSSGAWARMVEDHRRPERGGDDMPKFVMNFAYSSGSWARMLKLVDDRKAAVASLMEHLNGRLEAIYWGVESAQAYVIADLPDSVSATAAITAATKTGAFKDVQCHEVLTQDQLHEVVVLAKGSEPFYPAPGAQALERELDEARLEGRW